LAGNKPLLIILVLDTKAISMDPVINALVQSPFVREISNVKPDARNFTHNMGSNVPPFSLQKVVVKPYNNPSKTSQRSKHKFKIPEYGHLNRGYLRIRTRNQINSPHVLTENTYAPIFTADFAGIGTEAQYDDFFEKIRFPWVHATNLNRPVEKSFPFGGGGAGVMARTAMIDPTSDVVPGIPFTGTTGELASKSLVTVPEDFYGRSSNGWNVINILDEISLTSHEKLIERVPGESIPSEVVKMPEQLRDWYTRGMVGWADGDDDGDQLSEASHVQPWDPSACSRDCYGRYFTNDMISEGFTSNKVQNRMQHANFIVPITLSSLKNLSKNYQTRHTESMELEVSMKELGRGFNTRVGNLIDADTNHEVELVLIYHNWHANIESQIRNANYKPTIPAQIYSSGWFSELGPFKAISDTESLEIPLTCRNLATEIVIVGRSMSAGSGMVYDSMKKSKSDYVMNGKSDFECKIELMSGGRVLWSGSNKELQGVDSSDYDLKDRRARGGDCGFGGSNGSNIVNPSLDNEGFDGGWKDGQVSGFGITQGGVDFSFGDNMCIIRFGMQTTDEYFSGGLALQTLSTPELRITPIRGVNGSKWLDREFEFNVHIKHVNMVEINSMTGAIRKTLDA